ncbi:MAG: hypothetical protein QFB87_02050 [Patescibacteria group bacterium]|nr:hypothetical protein [Patescibacteria group bacterium]
MHLARFAHEVYVLNHNDIATDQHNHGVNVWQALNSGHNLALFMLFAVVIGGLFGFAIYLKSRPFFQKLGLQIDKASIFAPDIIRIAFGASLLFSASHAALYGPELPLHSLLGGKFIQALLWVSGTAIIIGLWSRVWAALMAVVWLWALVTKGTYLLTYANYLGEALAIILLPLQRMTVDYLITGKDKAKRLMVNARYSMPAARILFGFSLVYTAVSVKFLDSAISLDVVNHYHLTRFFPFDPLFVVLGAGLIELLVSVLYMAGLLQRFTTVIFLVFMTLSLFFFKESVWPHYLLIALGIGIFLHKPDIWAVDGYLFKPKRQKKLAK